MTEDGDNGYGRRLAHAMGAMRVQDLADKLGVTHQAIRKVLKGRSAEFSVTNHYKASDFLNIRPRWLATGMGPMRPRSAADDTWRAKAWELAESHAYDLGRVLLTDFCRDVDNATARDKAEQHSM